MRLPAWLLLDDDKRIVASVRAASADDARDIFKRYGIAGRWLRRHGE